MLSLRPEKGTEALVTDFDDLPSVGSNMSPTSHPLFPEFTFLRFIYFLFCILFALIYL